MVFYRKYRPQTISELDSSNLRETLLSVLSEKETPHAFLFTGPKGLGKTSTARIVAKVLNCERLATSKLASSSKDKKLNAKRYTLEADIEPCNECDQCKSITNGTNMDVLEIDGASNRGIDEIRDLREKIRLAPLSAKKKVYIIDEVHMLTTEAFNALLKTLEEPPSHVVFILCTTELHKVPATILSRCFHVQFVLATNEDLKRTFLRIVKSEKIDIEEDALQYIASLSGGSFRDGVKILEEATFLLKNEKITKSKVEEKFHTGHMGEYVQKALDLLIKKDAGGLFALSENMTKEGMDAKFFLEQLINQLHTILLSKIHGDSQHTLTLEIQDIKMLTQIFAKAHGEVKLSVVPQLPFEIAVLDWCRDKEVAASVKDFGEPKEMAVSVVVENKEILYQLIDHLKPVSPTLVGLLRGFRVTEYSDKALVLMTKYTYHKERLEEQQLLGFLKKAAIEVTGKEIEVKIKLEQ